tara:strand:+ start:890 stop:1279 length:390 start_codon:yes stop_codon:yes gene_type:complete
MTLSWLFYSHGGDTPIKRIMATQLQYKLSDEDYRSLFLKADPYDIKEEFGDHAHSVSTIYRRFRKYGLSNLRNHRKNLEVILEAKSAPSTSIQVIRRQVDYELAEAKNQAIRNIWVKIADFEETFGCMS